MALRRKDLSAMGLEPHQIDAIIDGHSETVNALQDRISELENKLEKADKNAETLKETQKELKSLKDKVEAEAKEREGKDYDELKKEFDEYKAEQEKKAAEAVKKTAFESLLKDMKVSDKGVEMIMKWQGVNGVELDDDGKITNAKDLRKSIKDDWADYIEQEAQKGADTDNPPGDTGNKGGKYGGMTKKEIMEIKNDTERQAAIAENHELFGF